MRFKKSAAGLAAAIAIVGGTLATAPSAQAQRGTHVHSIQGATNVRHQATTNSGLIVRLSNGTSVRMLCWADGQWAQGNHWTNRWFRVQIQGGPYNRVTGFVHASLVRNQTWTPRC